MDFDGICMQHHASKIAKVMLTSQENASTLAAAAVQPLGRAVFVKVWVQSAY